MKIVVCLGCVVVVVAVVAAIIVVVVFVASWFWSCGWSRARSFGRSLEAGYISPSLLRWLASCTHVGGIRG